MKLTPMGWCFSQVQFGHAGACANQASETAVAKNQALREAGAFVPPSFDELGDVIRWAHPAAHIQPMVTDGWNCPQHKHVL